MSAAPISHPHQRYWWLVVLQGIAVIILSIYLFLRPSGTVFLISIFLGLYLVFNGLVDILFAFLGKHVPDRSWSFLKGVVSAFVGGLILLAPYIFAQGLTSVFFLFVALSLLVLGGTRVFLKRKDIHKRRISDILVGLLMLLLGLLMLVAPQTSLELLVVMLAAWAGVTGVLMIIDGFDLRMNY
ncbi:MAG TPA: DUF308 domain-containing protein [Chloroflexota bacterium]|nr:DUF308 domain-containing protein [Chloroflexota bacterium]HUM71648.1 DUF308 domain-containing protein [Chloroflexota bacterium]